MHIGAVILSVLVGITVASCPADAQTYSAREKLRGVRTSVSVALPGSNCSGFSAKRGYNSGTRIEIGYYPTSAAALAACGSKATASYSPNVCYAVTSSADPRYRTFVFADGVMNRAGDSPDYTVGGVTYSYHAGACS